MKSGKKVSLIMQILIAMVLGVIVGVIWVKEPRASNSSARYG